MFTSVSVTDNVTMSHTLNVWFLVIFFFFVVSQNDVVLKTLIMVKVCFFFFFLDDTPFLTDHEKVFAQPAST